MGNYPAIISGFMAKGIPAEEILPRENVFTFHAWKALGRSVKKGEHGVWVVTFIPCTRENRETGEKETYKRPWTSTVFHVSQTRSTVPDGFNEDGSIADRRGLDPEPTTGTLGMTQ